MNNTELPLAVDLDGTLIKSDMLMESVLYFLHLDIRNITQIIKWWLKGRAFLKMKLAEHFEFSPEKLPYNQEFLSFLRSEKQRGRKLILATASDQKIADSIAKFVGLFDQVLASDGVVNLKSSAKRAALEKLYNHRGFDYAGNEQADLKVWEGANAAVLVNFPPKDVGAVLERTKIAYTFHEQGNTIVGLFKLFPKSYYFYLVLLSALFLFLNCCFKFFLVAVLLPPSLIIKSALLNLHRHRESALTSPSVLVRGEIWIYDLLAIMLGIDLLLLIALIFA